MITIIFGAPGSGKSSLNTYFLKRVYRREGIVRLDKASALIAKANENRKKPLSVPDKPPIFSNYKVSFQTGYEETFEPYLINGFYMGLANDRIPTQYIPPASAVFLDEAQRFYDSRKSATFPEFVSRFYEMHRHYHIDLWLAVQRPILIDANIRALSRKFIEVDHMEHEKDDAGRIVKTVFHCREFERWEEIEQYTQSGTECYKTTCYTHEGNIFRSFDSYSYFEAFLPPEGQDFRYLPFRANTASEIAQQDKIFYDTAEPDLFRKVPAKPKKEKTA